MNRMEVQTAVLGRAYPELLYDSDPDIEKYFDLRRSGRSSEALSLYNARLKAKYPEERSRVLLLRFFRRRDPRYGFMLRKAAMSLADMITARIKRTIDALTSPMRDLRLSDPYRLLKAVELVATYLPPDKYDASSSLDTYRKYASLLGHEERLMERTADLVKEYLFETGEDEESLNPDFVERSRRIEEEKKIKAHKSHFDLSRVRFDPHEIARIELPPQIIRKEDKVLGFCYKYWNLIGDPAFERSVLLYSRKNGTGHYSVFRAIKIGRQRRHTDDEILNTVSTVLSSSYSYSVQGDYYMQTVWRRIKAGITAPAAQAAPKRPPAQGSTPRPSEQVSEVVRVRIMPDESAASPEIAESVESAAMALPAQANLTSGPEAAAPTSARTIAPRGLPEKELARTRKGRAETPRPADPILPVRSIASDREPQGRAAPTKESVSDIIKRLSGKTYDVYHDIFMAGVRYSIRKWLGVHQSRAHGIFSPSINEAEELVYRFIERNYEDRHMDWEISEERAALRKSGYTVESISGIVEDCYRRIRESNN